MAQLREIERTSPALPLEFAELEKQSTNASQWTPEERLAHLYRLRRAYYGDDAINGKIQKILSVIDTNTSEVITTIDYR
jgi:hypothetical protein